MKTMEQPRNRHQQHQRQELTTEIEAWTPDRAKEQLANNKRNRPLVWSEVLKLAAAMEAGEWQMNGESIKIAVDGMLEDGQHRLAAIVQSGVTIKALTVRGLPKNVFDTIDIGKKRSGSDILSRRQEPNANVMAAALVWLWRYERGLLNKTARPRDSQLPELLESHPELRDSARLVQPARFRMPVGIAAACHYLFARKNDAEAERFFERLVNGEGLHRTDAVYLLREKLADHAAGKRKLSKPEIFALTVKAWNYHRAGEQVKRLTFRSSGTADTPPEPFPKVR